MSRVCTGFWTARYTIQWLYLPALQWQRTRLVVLIRWGWNTSSTTPTAHSTKAIPSYMQRKEGGNSGLEEAWVHVSILFRQVFEALEREMFMEGSLPADVGHFTYIYPNDNNK